MAKANSSAVSLPQPKPGKKRAAKKQISASSISDLIAKLPAEKRPLVDPSGPLFRSGLNWVMIVLPAPHSALHAHNKGAWYTKKAMISALATRAQSIAVRNRAPKWSGAFVEYRFYFGDDRKHDAANAVQSMKAAIDGIVRAGLIPDDDYCHLWIKSICCSVDAKNPRTELIFHQADPDAIKSLQNAQLELMP